MSDPSISISPPSKLSSSIATRAAAAQPVGSVVLTVTANAARLLASAGGALAAIYWLDLGATGFFIAGALGSIAYAVLAACAVIRVKHPLAGTVTERPTRHASKGESSYASITAIYFAGR
jgi:hypothetical protein